MSEEKLQFLPATYFPSKLFTNDVYFKSISGYICEAATIRESTRRGTAVVAIFHGGAVVDSTDER